MNNETPEKQPTDRASASGANDVIRPGAEIPSPYPGTHRRPRRSFFWPIALIGFGVLLLLANLGLIPSTGWAILWRLWPIALIALGVDVLVGHRSVAGAIASGVLILVLVGLAIGIVVFAEQIPILVELAKPSVLRTEHVEHPLGDISSAIVSIDWTSSPGQLSALEDSPNLIEADVSYRGDLVFEVQTSGNRATVILDTFLQGISTGAFDFGDDRPWDIKVSPLIPLDLRLDTSSGHGDFDLTELQLTDLEIDVGSGAVTVSLPSASTLEGTVDGGSGELDLILPEGVGLRIVLDRGSGALWPGERMRLVSGETDDDGVWETIDYDRSDYRIELTIDQGSGSLTVR